MALSFCLQKLNYGCFQELHGKSQNARERMTKFLVSEDKTHAVVVPGILKTKQISFEAPIQLTDHATYSSRHHRVTAFMAASRDRTAKHYVAPSISNDHTRPAASGAEESGEKPWRPS